MARSQFTFTFPNAQPGAAVTFSAAVYSSPVDAVADGPTLPLDPQRTVAVWTDAAELTATWVDGAGASIMAEASADHPIVAGQGGVPGTPPPAASLPSPVSVGQQLSTDGTNPLWLTPSAAADVQSTPRTQYASSGTIARAADSYTFTSPTGNNAAGLRVGRLGFFTASASLKVTAGSGIVMAVFKHGQVTPTVSLALLMSVWLSDDHAGTLTVFAQQAGGATSLGTVTVGTTNPYAVTIQRRLGQYVITVTPSGAAATTFTQDMTGIGNFRELGPMAVAVGKLDTQTTTALTLTATAVRVVRTPPDSYANMVAPEPLTSVARTPTTEMDAHLAAGLVALRSNVTLNSTNLRFFLYGGTGYTTQYAIDCWLATLLLRDVGALGLARDAWNGFLASQDGPTGFTPYAIATDGTQPAGTGQLSYFNFAQMCYFLSADGDTSWFDYGALQSHLFFWETNRKAADGCFITRNGYEGWDNNPAIEPTGVGNTPDLTYEWIGCSAMLYREYLAMQGIATSRGYTQDATSYATKATALKTAIQTSLWDSTSSWFMARKVSDGTYNRRYSADNVYALFAGVATTAQALAIRNRLMDTAHFLGAYGIRSLDATDAGYLPTGKDATTGTNWAGPIWPEVSYMAACGLWRYGYLNDALEVARRVGLVPTVNADQDSPQYGLPGEWNNSDTGLADPASTHLPYTGRAFGHLLAQWHLAKNYDPTLIDPTTVIRPVANMNVTHPETPFVSTPLTVTGPKTLQTATVYVFDGMQRPDGAIGTADTGQAWTNVTGSHIIVNRTARVTWVTGGFTTLTTIDGAHASSYGEMVLRLSPAANRTNVSLAGGVVDASNYLMADVLDGTVSLYSVVAGTATLRQQFSPATLKAGTVHSVGIRFTGTTATVYADGLALGAAYTLTAGEQAAITGTKWGLRSFTNTGSQEDGNTQVRRFVVTS